MDNFITPVKNVFFTCPLPLYYLLYPIRIPEKFTISSSIMKQRMDEFFPLMKDNTHSWQK